MNTQEILLRTLAKSNKNYNFQSLPKGFSRSSLHSAIQGNVVSAASFLFVEPKR